MRKRLYRGWNTADVKPVTGRKLLVKKEGCLLYENGFTFDGKDFVGRNGSEKIQIWAYA